MPEKKTMERARKDKRRGRSPSTQAGEFVHEEIEHVREGKHGARSTQQAIAIGYRAKLRHGFGDAKEARRLMEALIAAEPNNAEAHAALAGWHLDAVAQLGAFVARTVSRHSPLSLFARAVPNRRHASVLESLQPQRQERDVFPTVYAMNTRKALAALLDRDFEWSVTHRPSLDQYLLRWPRAARAVMVVEARLPRSAQAVLVVAARKK